MTVASGSSVRPSLAYLLLTLATVLCTPHALAAATEREAQQARKKPLQRCDQLKGDAELDCLQKARERVVEARQKREAGTATSKDAESGKSTESAKGAGAGKTAQSKSAEADKSLSSKKAAASEKSADPGKSEGKK